jgi:drug/metabolite transporter (DMT)-like permease
MGVYLFNGLRFLVGAVTLLPFAARSSWRFEGSARAGVILAGVLLYAAGAFQQMGLRFTTAGNAGFITGLYVVLIPIILAAGLRRAPTIRVLLASALAAGGLFLLSTGGRLQINTGDGLELVGAFLWAFHVILIGWLVQRADVLPLAISQYVICALLSLGTSFLLESNSIEAIRESSWAIVYTGLFSIGAGYTLQAVGQRHAPPADAAIILSFEAAFAAIFGWVFLSETLSALQLLGCGLMLTGMIISQFRAAAPGPAPP